jgi:hypothetical protein
MIGFIFRKRPAVAGLILGTLIGLMIGGGYGATSAWLCSGIRKCPASWEPFVVVSSIIFVLVLISTVAVSVLGAKAYKIFDTSIGGDAAYGASGGRGGESSSNGSQKVDVS